MQKVAFRSAKGNLLQARLPPFRISSAGTGVKQCRREPCGSGRARDRWVANRNFLYAPKTSVFRPNVSLYPFKSRTCANNPCAIGIMRRHAGRCPIFP